MRESSPFLSEYHSELDERLLSRADAVVSMREVYEGSKGPNVIAMRHDVDNEIEPALALAAWEAERGYRSTYFILHTAPYWDSIWLRPSLEQISELGHEIGIHTNALVEGLLTGEDPDLILDEAIARLRSWGFQIRGVAGHGDPHCYTDQVVSFANDEQFVQCARPELGEPDRLLVRGDRRLWLRPRPLSDFGLEYETLRLGRALYLSDSGGEWKPSFAETVAGFPSELGQLHMLQHPCWWRQALCLSEVAA